MQATFKKQIHFIFKGFITKEMKPEEYQKQVKKAKKLVEKEENKGQVYVVRGYPNKWKIKQKV